MGETRRHPHPNEIQRFLRGDSPPLERQRIVLHLLAGCGACAAILRPLWGFADEPLMELRRGR